MSAELTVLVDDAAPFETDATNNSGSSTVEVTEHELVRSNVLVQALGGYGAQFNNHVYAPITPWPAGDGLRRYRGQGEGAPAAARPHLLQRQLGRELGQDASRVAAELRVVHRGRAACAGGGRDDRHLLPEPRQCEERAWTGDGASSRMCSKSSSRATASRTSAGLRSGTSPTPARSRSPSTTRS